LREKGSTRCRIDVIVGGTSHQFCDEKKRVKRREREKGRGERERREKEGEERERKRERKW
jgi:hypothetical protein